MSKPSNRFTKLAITLFSGEITEVETEVAKKFVSALTKIIKDLNNWVEKVQENLNKVSDYQGDPKQLKVARSYFDTKMKEQKEKYEAIREELSKLIDEKNNSEVDINEIKDLKMIEDIGSITKESEKFTDIYNLFYETLDLIGESQFLDEYKSKAQAVIDAKESFAEILESVSDRVKRDILGKITM